MIQFKQIPLNGLDTFEDELLYLLGGSIEILAGIQTDSEISGATITNCLLVCEPEPVESVYPPKIVKLFGKYNKSFIGLFEIRSVINGGRYKLNIKENMQELSEKVAKIMRCG
jgi:hypothetical protein